MPEPQTHSFALGDFEVTTVLDGVIVRDNGHEVFGANRDPAEVEALAAAHGLDVRALENNFVPVVVRTPDALILFDTGNGDTRRPAAGHLVARLAAIGVRPDDIDIVALSHLHGDHVGGLIDEGRPVFDRARLLCGRREFTYWTEETEAPQIEAKVRPLADRFTLIDDGATVADGVVAEAAFGHTPGHTIFHLESRGARLTLAADTANHPILALIDPDWHFKMDVDAESAVATRRRVFDRLADTATPFVGHHMPFPALGRVERAGAGYRWIPLAHPDEASA